MTALLQRWVNIRREEVAPVLAAASFFFCILTALMVVRPARDALGLQRGIEEIAWLFQGTLIITLLVNPVFGRLVSRYRRMVFVAATYLFFSVSLLAFHALLVLTPEAIGVRVGQVFYVWFSVFNLFVVMVFWAVMADRFTLEQSKRFFAVIAVGGTLGAVHGPWLASLLAQRTGTASLLLVTAGFLALALVPAWLVGRLRSDREVAREESGTVADPPPDEGAIIGGSAWEGFRAVFRSRYLMGIGGFALVVAVMATFIYFTRLQMVAEYSLDLDTQTTAFANIDLLRQFATLVVQVFVAGHLIRRFGVSLALVLLPITVVIGFVSLAVTGALAVLVAFDVAFAAVQRGVMRPARETLFTVVSREDKYKSKAFIDTFVYRGGDSLAAGASGLITAMGLAMVALVSLVVPLAVVWGALGVWLGRAQHREARARRAKVAALAEAVS
jgi:ATP:ADP antiporter, AAA family